MLGSFHYFLEGDPLLLQKDFPMRFAGLSKYTSRRLLQTDFEWLLRSYRQSSGISAEGGILIHQNLTS